MKPIKKVALFHSLCSVGKASLTNMIPILSSMEIEVCPIPTILLSTHTGGYGLPAKQHVTAKYICDMADHFKKTEVSFDLIFVGYLGSVEVLDGIKYFMEQFPETTVMIDPIMGDHGRCYQSIDETYTTAFRNLLQYADGLFPNITEACMLTGHPYKECFTESELRQIADLLLQKGLHHVIITSVKLSDALYGNIYATKDSFEIIRFKKESFDFHGTGDVFDAVLIGYILCGHSWSDSIKKAHQHTCQILEESSKCNYDTKEGLLVEKNLHFNV